MNRDREKHKVTVHRTIYGGIRPILWRRIKLRKQWRKRKKNMSFVRFQWKQLTEYREKWKLSTVIMALDGNNKIGYGKHVAFVVAARWRHTVNANEQNVSLFGLIIIKFVYLFWTAVAAETGKVFRFFSFCVWVFGKPFKCRRYINDLMCDSTPTNFSSSTILFDFVFLFLVRRPCHSSVPPDRKSERDPLEISYKLGWTLNESLFVWRT